MNDKLRVAVTGASGFIGREFLRAFASHEVTGMCFSRSNPGLVSVDLKNPNTVSEFMSRVKPDVVIHCAARPSVDWCELNPGPARELNLIATSQLAEESSRVGATFVFLSTDYVFDGTSGPYSEADTPNPINVYGRLKLEAEEAIRRVGNNHLIVRTTNVYGFDPDSKNFLMALLPRLLDREPASVASDQFGNPTLVSDLCSVTRELVEAKQSGTFHVTGPDLVNRAEWLRRAAVIFGANPDLVSGVLTDDLDQPAPRPRKSGLVSNTLSTVVSNPPRNLDDGLRVMKGDSDRGSANCQFASLVS